MQRFFAFYRHWTLTVQNHFLFVKLHLSLLRLLLLLLLLLYDHAVVGGGARGHCGDRRGSVGFGGTRAAITRVMVIAVVDLWIPAESHMIVVLVRMMAVVVVVIVVVSQTAMERRTTFKLLLLLLVADI